MAIFINTTTIFRVSFDKDIYDQYVKLGRLITGVEKAGNQPFTILPFGPYMEVKTHEVEGHYEAFKLREIPKAHTTPDTLEIHFEGNLNKEVIKELIKRTNQALDVVGWKDIVNILNANVTVHTTERFEVEI